MTNYARFMISLLVILMMLAFISCSTENYKTPVTQSIKEIEKAINENDLRRFSTQISSTNLNKHFKIFSIFVSLFDKTDPNSNIINFIPVEFKESMFGGISVNISIEYKGTINALKIQALSDILKKIIQIGMPDRVTFKYNKIDNHYKLTGISFGLVYDGLLSASNFVI